MLAGGAAAALTAVARGNREATAHHGYAGPGDPCRDSTQCVGADAPLVCADNGFDWDGPLNCCTYEGNPCGFDAACCGLAACVGGVCTGVGFARTPPSSCTGEGCPCTPNTPNPCDQGLVCCGGVDPTLGTCMPLYSCTGGGLPGEVCPRYCLPGPTQCPSCVSGYCTAAGYCG